MPRTTLDLDALVLRELRRRGARERKSMGTVASELIVRALGETERRAPLQLRWTSRDLGRPRVDLEDKESVRVLLDRGS
ncbi:MAG: antitoxin [Candidatus Dormibacteraeota bacterium]|nr:antitoxin [Candidatus Dormibacteraeota bacterium]